jgi:hypothetical protein
MSTSKIETIPNWCSTVDSPTYKLTWYIVNSDVFENPLLLNNIPDTDTFNAKDNNAVNSKKAVVIAASGETSEYSIENLVLQSRISPGTDTGNTTTGAFQFDIYEPGGFQLLSRILQLSHAFGFSTMQAATYILKVEFIGRNALNSAPERFPGVFYYPMMMSTINASAGPEGSQYNIVGANQHKIAVTASKIVTDIKLASIITVREFIDSMKTALNDHEQNIRKRQITDGSVLNAKEWDIKIMPNFEKYMNSPMHSDIDINGTGHPNDLKNPSRIVYTVPKGTNIVKYIIDQLTTHVPDFYNTFDENKTDNKNIQDKLSQASSQRRDQYAGGTGKSKPNLDMYVNEFIKITPSIQYETGVKDLYTNTDQEKLTLYIGLSKSHTNPQHKVKEQNEATINASYQARRLELLPIYKAYNFLFSGNNTEVLDFNLNFNQMFYLTRDPSDAAGYTKIVGEMGRGEEVKVTSTIPTYLSELSVNNVSPNVQLETIAYDGKAAESKDQKNSDAPNSVTAADAAAIHAASNDYIMFDITIKGDPYWLGTPGSYTTADKNTTLIENLDEDSLIVFINYLPDNGKTGGARKLDIASSGVYKILEVESKFQLGKFTQSLKGMRDRNSSTDLIQKQLIKIGSQNGN